MTVINFNLSSMAGYVYIKKTREYLDYVERHLNCIQVVYNIVGPLFAELEEIDSLSLKKAVFQHDISKFSIEEFVQYRQTFYPVIADEQEASLFSAALAHHYAANHHHAESIETFTDLAHLVIDWMAMAMADRDNMSVANFFKLKQDSLNLSEKHVDFLVKLLTIVGKC